MKIRWIIGLCSVLIASQTIGQGPVITQFRTQGLLTWTNAPGPGSHFTVEWAPSAFGPWHRTWQVPDRTDAGITTEFTVPVPLFYRVTQSQQEPPRDMEYVEAGSFLMGDPWQEDPSSDGEWAVHEVWLDAFYMDRYEVSRRLWDRVYHWGLTNGFTDLPAGSSQQLFANIKTDHMPHLGVTWYDAVKWCNARSLMEGLQPAYYTFSFFLPMNLYTTGTVDLAVSYVDWQATGYRLPTEAEWEKAARGGLRGHHFPWPSYGAGHTNYIDGSQANFRNSGDSLDPGTTPVGWFDGFQPLFPDGVDMANGYGLYDMAGNVSEWCWDWYDNQFYTNPLATDDNTRGPPAKDAANGITARVIRGGYYESGSVLELRCAARSQALDPGASSGFRCVRKP